MKLIRDPRATKIVCTLGPSSSSHDVIRNMVRAGMDVARLNFSHGTPESHRQVAETIRSVSRELDRPVGILQDLQGHKVRVGRPEGHDPVQLEPGQEVLVGHGESISPERLGIDYRAVTEHVGVGQPIYIDDGEIELDVVSIDGEDLRCKVHLGGPVGGRKGVIFPEARLEFPLLSAKDLEDARIGVELGVDFVAMSFVRQATEIREMRRHLEQSGDTRPFLVAKIEDREGIDNLEEILRAADGVLIARGDMGVSLPREQVPSMQKSITHQANELGVPVITATQMLESMTHRDKPTRAEVNDVHNAVLDGTDAVMLSGETASGSYPILAVEEMDRICRRAEQDYHRTPGKVVQSKEGLRTRMADAAATLADNLDARCILAFSLAGSNLRALSSTRTSVPVYGVVPDERVLRQLLLHRGLTLNTQPVTSNLEDLIRPVLSQLRRQEIASSSDNVLVFASRPEPETKENYLLRLYVLE